MAVSHNYPPHYSHHASRRWSRLIDYPLTSMACSLSSTCDSDIFSISPIFCSSSGSIGRGSAVFAFTFFLPPKNCEVWCVCVCVCMGVCERWETVFSFVGLHCTCVLVFVKEWIISDLQSYDQNLAGQHIFHTLMSFICQPFV